MTISFTVHGTPAPKGSMRAIARGRAIHDNARTRPWADAIAWHARQHMRGKPPIAGPVMLCLIFYLPRPKSVKRELPSVKPDVDKLIRNVLDAVTGILWNDDGQVVHVMGQKAYADPPGDRRGMTPGVHIIAIDLDAANARAEVPDGQA